MGLSVGDDAWHGLNGAGGYLFDCGTYLPLGQPFVLFNFYPSSVAVHGKNLYDCWLGGYRIPSSGLIL